MTNLTTTVKALDTKTMLSLYNALTGKTTSKFATREKGEVQTLGVVKMAGPEATIDQLKKLGVKVKVNPLTSKIKKVKAAKSTIKKGTDLKAPDNGCPIPCREGSKQAILLDMLSRYGGASMDELLEALSGGKKPWIEATIRSGFGWDMKQKGYGVRSEFDAEGTERFFIVLPTDENGNEFAIPPHRPRKGVRQTHHEA